MSSSANTPKRTRLQSCLRGIYNSDKKTFIGRTCASWAKISLFYLIYYTCLACFFVGMLSVLLFCIMSPDQPMLTGQQSILRTGPGVSIQPFFRNEKDGTRESTLIQVTGAAGLFFQRYKNYTTELFKPYNDQKENQEICDLELDKRSTDISKPCFFPLTQLGACKDPWEVLATTGSPCIFLKVNKIFGWLPEPTEGATNPMVDCYGQNTADAENLGEIVYTPSTTYNGKTLGKISHAFFPFIRQSNYSSPLVAMTFPKIRFNVIILLKCQVRGIGPNAGESQFELLVDKPKSTDA